MRKTTTQGLKFEICSAVRIGRWYIIKI